MNYIKELESEKLHAERMTAAASQWMERARELQMKLTIAVFAAGGEVIAEQRHLNEARELTLIEDEMPGRFAMRLRTVRKGQG